MISLYHFQKAVLQFIPPNPPLKVLQFIPPNPPLKGGNNKLVCSTNYSRMVLVLSWE